MRHNISIEFTSLWRMQSNGCGQFTLYADVNRTKKKNMNREARWKCLLFVETTHDVTQSDVSIAISNMLIRNPLILPHDLAELHNSHCKMWYAYHFLMNLFSTRIHLDTMYFYLILFYFIFLWLFSDKLVQCCTRNSHTIYLCYGHYIAGFKQQCT